MGKEKVKFKDLSAWLKLSVVMGWLLAGELLLVFILGVIAASLGGV